MSISQSSRRSFIKTTIAAGVAPMFLPGRIWSAEVKPNERLSIGLIGMGKMNSGHLNDWLKRADTQVVAVCDVDTTRRESAKKTAETFYSKAAGSGYKGCAAFANFEDVLSRKDIDLVCVATPDHWHAIIDIAAAKAGKDIYGEKPMTETVHEAWALVKAVRDNNRVFQTGSQQRSSREFRVACELARNGIIGKIYHVAVGVGGPGKPCDLPEEAMEPGLDWDRWLGPAPMRPYHSELSPRGVHNHFPNWRKYWEYGGGMVTDWGAHHFDICQWGLGEDGRGPLEINPVGKPDAQEGVKLKYGNGVEVTHVSQNGVTFHGEAGMIFVNRGRFILKLGDRVVADFSKQDSKPPLAAQLDAVEKEFLTGAKIKLQATTGHKDDFIACVRSRQRPIADVEIGARTVTTCHLVNFAYRYGQKIEWNPEKLEFAGGTGKPEWLTREYRGNWKV
ncbi:MAG: Gfo/Idh/MocA family oxidoreductase [Chthoniobacteraceae bacterium]